MKSICKLIVMSFLIVATCVFHTGLAYGANIPSPVIAEDHNYRGLAVQNAIWIDTETLPDGTKKYKFSIKPSLKGAIAGAQGGAAAGSSMCVATGIGAPVAPICGLVGGTIGGTLGLFFGPADI